MYVYVTQQRHNWSLRYFIWHFTGNLSYTQIPLRQAHNNGQTSGNVYMEVELALLQRQTNFVFEDWLSQYDRNRKPKSGFH